METENPVGWNEVMRASAEQVKSEEFDELLPCKLTEKEMAEIARKTGKIRLERRAVDHQLKMAKDRFKSQLDVLDASLEELGEKAELGVESRMVGCREDHLYRLGQLRVTRLDTGEVIRERALLSHERQATLPGIEAKGYEQQVSEEDPIESEDEGGIFNCAITEGEISDPDSLILDADAHPDVEAAPKKRGRKPSQP